MDPTQTNPTKTEEPRPNPTNPTQPIGQPNPWTTLRKIWQFSGGSRWFGWVRTIYGCKKMAVLKSSKSRSLLRKFAPKNSRRNHGISNISKSRPSMYKRESCPRPFYFIKDQIATKMRKKLSNCPKI